MVFLDQLKDGKIVHERRIYDFTGLLMKSASESKAHLVIRGPQRMMPCSCAASSASRRTSPSACPRDSLKNGGLNGSSALCGVPV